MKRLGVVLLVLGIVAIIVALFPGIFEPNPKEGFGWQQRIALGAGIVLAVVGLLMAVKGKPCAACEAAPPSEAPTEPPMKAAADAPAEPAAEKPAEEEPKPEGPASAPDD